MARDPRAVSRDAADRMARELTQRVEPIVAGALRRTLRPVARGLTAAGTPIEHAELDQIRTLWAEQIPTVVAVLEPVYTTSAAAAWRRWTSETFPTTQDLAQAFLQTAPNRLALVGDDLWDEARRVLAAGVEAGEGYDVLRRRIADSLNLSDDSLNSRAELIARTETQSAFAAGSLAGIRMLPDDVRPGYKRWLATIALNTRDAHLEADGQLRAINEPFNVGGEELDAPGDPSASIGLTASCRCTMTFEREPTELDDTGRQFLDTQEIAEIDRIFEERGITRGIAAASYDGRASMPRTWTTPDDTALAFEDQETGDGRMYVAGCFYWEGDSWPLQHADELGFGHEGAELVGAIMSIDRDGQRITGSGELYGDTVAGSSTINLLEQDAPLGVSVDLDDMDVEIIDRNPSEDDDGVMLMASGLTASLMPDGALRFHDTSSPVAAAIVAAAGDSDIADGEVVFTESSGDVLVRVTKARIRGATLVSMPAFAGARIVLDPADTTDDAVTAALVGDTGLPVHDNREREWDGQAAASRVLAWATNDEDEVDAARLARAFLWRNDDANPATLSAYSLGFADVINDQLRIIARGVFAAAGGRGVDEADIPEDDKDRVRSRICSLYERLADAFDDDGIVCPVDDDDASSDAVTAAGGPQVPSRAWFDDQPLDGPTALTPTDVGQVFGHLAIDQQPDGSTTCHTGFADRCVTVPDDDDFSYFHLGEVETDDGPVAVGRLTVGGGHANIRDGWRAAVDHYDNAGTAVAVVRAYRDEHGIAVAGAIVPEATDEQIAALRRSPLSGDWRNIGGKLRLVAALAVNSPGFPVPRARVAAAGRPEALVAAGVLVDTAATPEASAALDTAQIAAAVADELEARQHWASEREQLAEIVADARKVERDRLAELVHGGG